MNEGWIPSADAVNQIADWVRQAGQIALGYFNRVTPRYKADHTFVTQADLEIEDFLAERLRAAFPEYGLISEEKTQAQAKLWAPGVWTIDPLDGTTAFVHGLPGWGISLGLLYRGQPSFGLFYMPLLSDMTCTDLGGVRSTPTVRSDWGPKSFLAVNASAHCDFAISVQRTRAMGSVSANLVYTARGSAAAAFIPKAYVWDLVAGAAILAQSGGKLCYLSGESINYLQLLDGQPAPEPIVAGHPGLLDELRHSIRPRSLNLGTARDASRARFQVGGDCSSVSHA